MAPGEKPPVCADVFYQKGTFHSESEQISKQILEFEGESPVTYPIKSEIQNSVKGILECRQEILEFAVQKF